MLEYIKRDFSSKSGAEIIQLTSALKMHVNLYPETPVFTLDSSRFVYLRYMDPNEKKEYWVCDLRNFELSQLTNEDNIYGAVVSKNNYFYYTTIAGNAISLNRKSIDHLEKEIIAEVNGYQFPYVLGSVSPDGKQYVTGAYDEKLRESALLSFDIENGTGKTIYSSPFITNPHMGFEPGDGQDILIQVNTKIKSDEEGQPDLLRAQLKLIDRNGENERVLKIGLPFSPKIQGHQNWLGTSKRIVSTLSREKAGTIVSISEEDDKPVTLSTGHMFHHTASTSCGRWFVCDETENKCILIGSVKTGKCRVLCDSKSSFGHPQYTHPHPFFTPDRKMIIFNSDATGIPQIYAAVIPEGFLEKLEN